MYTASYWFLREADGAIHFYFLLCKSRPDGVPNEGTRDTRVLTRGRARASGALFKCLVSWFSLSPNLVGEQLPSERQINW